MLNANEMFTEEDRQKALGLYTGYDLAVERLVFRQLPPRKIKTVFYGDSIIWGFAVHEFFPGSEFINRGIPGDTLSGLYFRLDDDVFPYHPEQVVMMAGINGIQEDNARMMKKYETIGDLITGCGAKLYLGSVLPLRHGDKWDRFQYQDKIVALNGFLKELAERKYAGFIDFHSAVKDEKGELAEAYAREDGTHVRFPGYRAMAGALEKVVSLY